MRSTEGLVSFNAGSGKVCKAMGVFYNPLMEFNRSISLLVIRTMGNRLKIGLPLAASGIRGLRILKELDGEHEVVLNDVSPEAVKLIKANLRLNKLKAKVFNKEANSFLLDSKGFNYIDIDPFGSPNPFLDSAIRRISRHGILAVTATDTAPLAGTYVKACLRKYWARPLRNDFMHETGLRILIRKVQLVAAQYDKAATPLLAYYKNHYFRVFFRMEKSKKLADKLLSSHRILAYSSAHLGSAKQGEKYGPVYAGALWDKQFLKGLATEDESMKNFISIIREEAKLNSIGFIGLGTLGKIYKPKALLKKEELIKKLIATGHKACSTHFTPEAIRFEGQPDFRLLL